MSVEVAARVSLCLFEAGCGANQYAVRSWLRRESVRLGYCGAGCCSLQNWFEKSFQSAVVSQVSDNDLLSLLY